MLGAPEWVYVKGAEEPLPARRLLGAAAVRESTLVGRIHEMRTVAGILDQAISGAGCVARVVGPPGIGKSRIMREAVTLVIGRGVKWWDRRRPSRCEMIEALRLADTAPNTGASCRGHRAVR